MKDAKSDFFRNLILTTYLVNCKIGLFANVDGNLEEVGSTDYERLDIPFVIDDNLAKNDTELVFTGISNTTVSAWGIFNEQGNLLYNGLFKQPFEIGATSDLTIIKNGIEIEER